MTYEELRERVARAIYDAWNMSGVPYDSPTVKGNVFREGKAQADAAIRAVIEALANEAEHLHVHWDQSVTDEASPDGDGADSVADWLRSHVPEVHP